jgi:aryl-alcohol dehydrogenase-like predicted oxidoreductase
MKTRKLGKTGRSISVMGYGCGGYWGYNIFDEKKAIGLVHQAIDGGVTFFDTGASYSGGNAEVRLGKAIKGIDTSKLIIGTKVGTVKKGKKLVKDFSCDSIFKQVENSLKNLGLDSIPLLQLHSPHLEHLDDDIFETLNLLKEQGKVQMTGASCDGKVLEKALSFNQLDVIMMTYNLIEKKALKQLEMAHEKGCGILIKSPLCHTLYSNDIFKLRRLSDVWYFLRVLKNYRPMLIEGRKYRFINRIEGWSGHEIALLYALHDKVSCVVTGTTNPKNMERNLAAFMKELPAELRQQIGEV